MEIEIISFGKIAEFISPQQLTIGDLPDTDALKLQLEQLFPALSGIKYVIALNQQIVQMNTPLQEHFTLAIMPPFSGG